MNHLDLFSGIGGFAYAAQQVWGEEHNIVAFVEQDKYCQKVLNKHWPEVPIFNDIKEYRYGDVANTESADDKTSKNTEGWSQMQSGRGSCRSGTVKIDILTGDRTYDRPAIGLLTGGFPCQPFSFAGKRKGKSDDRYLWPEMFRVIQEAKPTWIIGENVPGIINMGLETTVLDLEAEGYEVELLVLPACGVGAWHQRYRVWIVAHTYSAQCDRRGISSRSKNRNASEDVDNSECKRQSRQGKYEQSLSSAKGEKGKADNVEPVSIGRIWPAEPAVGRVANGIPNRVDRLKGLGNAIVPQCVVPIMWAIKELVNKKGGI